jgi:hypothetical protein
MTFRLPAASFVAAAVGAAGCHGCRGDHPYVPYTIDSAPPSAESDAGAGAGAGLAASVDAARPGAAGELATIAPAGTTRWPVDDVVLQAPDGQVFVSAIVRDFDDDGAKDAFAVVRSAEGNEPGELAFYHGRPHAELLDAPTSTVSPPALPRDKSCVPADRLVVAGARSVLVQLGASCPLQGSSNPDRWLAVVSGGQQARVTLALTIADATGAPTLSIDAVTADRDGDGLDDVALGVTLEGGAGPLEPGPRVAATFVWLDRPAGLSRDLSATESSFATLAATAAGRAARPKEAPAVPAFVSQARALWRAMCAEGGAPRAVGVAGTGAIACGGAHALEGLGLAEVRAHCTMGDALRAALALDRAERPPASHTASRVAEAQRWIGQIAPPMNARAVRMVAAVPIVSQGREPTWGSLAFEPTGALLVRTRAGVVRVDPEAGDEVQADGVAEWSPAMASPDRAMRWIETYDPCDGLPLRATFSPAEGDDMRDVPLPVPAPIGGRCAGARGAPVRALPLAWGPGGLEAIVDGEPVLISADLTRATPLPASLGQPVTPGAPRSPDGSRFVVATGVGLVVRGGSKTRILRASELDGTYGEQRDCTVSNVVGDDSVHVACVRSGRAWVGAWDGS